MSTCGYPGASLLQRLCQNVPALPSSMFAAVPSSPAVSSELAVAVICAFGMRAREATAASCAVCTVRTSQSTR